MSLEQAYPASVAAFPSLRQSLLAAFDLCALESRFEALYATGWSTPAQARGSIFHRVATECLLAMHRQGEERIEVDVALAILHEQLRQDEADRICPRCDSREIEPGVRQGLRTCASCGERFESAFLNIPAREVAPLYWIVKKWAHESVFPIRALVAVEQRLTSRVSYPHPEGGHCEREISGMPDAIFIHDADTHMVVRDWKTGWALPPPTEISFEGYFQQRFYALLIFDTFSTIKRVTLREEYVRLGEAREATIWREDAEDLRSEIAALAERFDRAFSENVYPPTPGRHCSWCLRPTACPIPAFARGEGRIVSEERARQIAHQWLAGRAIVEQTTDQLKAWVGVHGPMELRDARGVRVIGFRESERTSRPTLEEIEAARRAAGGRLSQKALDALYRTTKTTRFDLHVPTRRTVEPDDEELMGQLAASLEQARAARGIEEAS